MKNTVFQRIWLPGFLLQSVSIGGGYATGRELVEFFLTAGPLGGLLGLGVTIIGFSVISALCFELARITKKHNYRGFFRQLLGRGWFLFDIAYLLFALLVISVIGAASGEMVSTHFGFSPLVGTMSLMLLVAGIVFWGTALIEKVMASWSFVLYAVYAVFVVLFVAKFGEGFMDKFRTVAIGETWLLGGIKYIGYGVAMIPVILFCVKHMESRRDALMAGTLAGPLAMIPALMFFLAMTASYPAIVDSKVPADFMIQKLDISWLKLIFYVVVFGTFVETAAGMIHSINERIGDALAEKNRHMPSWLRPIVAVLTLFVAVVLARQVGLIDLIAKGYGTLTFAFMAVFILPLFTVGVWKIWFANSPAQQSERIEPAL